MEQHIEKIISQGDENGNEMVVKFQLPSGLEIIGLPTKNFYGGYWDLGPTWNYAVLADEPFLMAVNEVISHCELLIDSGDVAPRNGNRFAATGKADFKNYIADLKSEY